MIKKTVPAIILSLLAGTAFGQATSLDEKAEKIKSSYQALSPKVQAKLRAESSQKNSQASNYQLPFELSVNERTGSVSLNYTLDKVPGMSKQTAIDIGLSFSGKKSGSRMLGLPAGWSYQIDYLDVNRQGKEVLHLSNGQHYLLSSSSESGLLYYRLKNMELKRLYQDGHFNGYLLTHLNGTKEWFSRNGLLLRLEDKDGNRLIYTYDNKYSTVDDTWLESIKTESKDDQIKQQVDFSYNRNQITITYPDGNTTLLKTRGDTVTSIIDKMGRSIDLDYNFTGDSLSDLQVSYPSGKFEQIAFNNRIKVKGSPTGIPAVSSVKVYPEGIGQPLTTKYEYQLNGHNFSGYPDYPDSQTSDPSADPLLQSDDTDYTYQVKKTDSNGQETITTYNHLHQAIKKESYDSFGQPLSTQKLAYGCSDPLSPSCQPGQTIGDSYQNLPANYQTPSITQQTSYGPAQGNGGFSSRVKQVKTQFNDYGLPVATYEYEKKNYPSLITSLSDNQKLTSRNVLGLLASPKDNTFQLTKVTKMDYDLPAPGSNDTQPHYGIQRQKDVYDCKANVWKETQNTLTDNGKEIKNQRVGMVNESASNGNVCQKAIDGALNSQQMDFVKQQSYQYDPTGRKTATTLSWVNDSSNESKPGPDQATKSVAYHYDPSSKTYTVVNCSNSGIPVSQTKYDVTTGNKLSDWSLKSGQKANQLLSMSNGSSLCQSTSSISQLSSDPGQLYDGTQYKYDALGRKITEISPLGVKQHWHYDIVHDQDGKTLQKVTQIKPTGYQQYKYLDSLGHKIKEADNMGGDGQLLPEGQERTLATYDYYQQTNIRPNDAPQDSPVRLIALQGKLKSKTDQLGNVTRYWYDPQGHVAAQKDALGNIEIMTHNPVLLKKTHYHNGSKIQESYMNDQQKVIKSLQYSTDQALQGNGSPKTSAVAVKTYDGQGQVVSNKVLASPEQIKHSD